MQLLVAIAEKLLPRVQEAENTLVNTAHQASTLVTHRATQAINQATSTAENTKNAMTEVGGTAVRTVSSLTTKTLETTGSLKESLPHMQDFTTAMAQQWLASHPVIAWVLTYPLWAVGIALLLILTFGGLLKAIARFFEHAGITILKAPFWLMGLLFNWGSKTFQKSNPQKISDAESRDQKLARIQQRLEEISQEQNTLLGEMRELLKGRDRAEFL